MRNFFRRQAEPVAPTPPANPAAELARVGAEKRAARRRSERNAFHREMRERLGMSAHPAFEEN